MEELGEGEKNYARLLAKQMQLVDEQKKPSPVASEESKATICPDSIIEHISNAMSKQNQRGQL